LDTEALLQKDQHLRLEEIEKIYLSRAYRADGKYWQDVEKIFKEEAYEKIKWLSRDILWGEDDLGPIRMGSEFRIYVIIFKNQNIRVDVELFEHELDKVPIVFHPPRIALTKTINRNQLKYFNLPYQIFPYE
jgi:hypothetical protein